MIGRQNLTRLGAALIASFGLAATASAATSVTLYGILDTGYGYSNYRYDHGGVTARAVSSGARDGYLKSSRFGIKGSEDLGDGLRAIFLLEQGFNPNTGSGKAGYVFSKKAYAGLSSDDWGSLTIGRQKTLSDQFHSVDTTKSLGKAERTFGGTGITHDNLFLYVSPELAGVKFGAGYATSGAIHRHQPDDTQDVDRDNFVTVGAAYKGGPLRLAATLDRERANDANGHAKSYAVTNWMLSGSWDFEVVKLTLAYGEDRNGKLKKPADVSKDTLGGYTPRGLGDYNNAGFKSHNHYVGLAIPAAGGTVGLTWAHSSSNLSDVYADVHPGQQLSSRSQNTYAANYVYPLSKRTQVYVYGARVTGVAYLTGFNATEAGVGMRHNF